MSSIVVPAPKLLASCDACRARKVKCIKRYQADVACISCTKRRQECNFSSMKPRVSRASYTDSGRQQPQLDEEENLRELGPPRQASIGSSIHYTQTPPNALDATPVEHLRHQVRTPDASAMLSPSSVAQTRDGSASQPTQATDVPSEPVILVDDREVSCSGLAFFSERRMDALSKRLGHGRVRELVNKIENHIQAFVFGPVDSIPTPEEIRDDKGCYSLTDDRKRLYLNAYFEHVHPILPFLDPESFHNLVFSPQPSGIVPPNKAITSLLYAVLAIGSLFHDCGSFKAFTGTSWHLFGVALSTFPHIIFGRRTLISAQAITAMAIFASSYCAVSIEDVLISEAARMATSLSLNKRHGTSELDIAAQRTFWVIYILDKEYSFNSNKSSNIPDYDISSPLSSSPSIHGSTTYDWLACQATYARMLSRAREGLFSTAAQLLPKKTLQERLQTMQDDLEQWKAEVPELFRPGSPLRPHHLPKPSDLAMAIRMHFSYYHLRMALLRRTLYAWGEDLGRLMDVKVSLAEASRAIIDLTHFIPLEPFSLPWTLFHVPHSALFILFDFVVDNPRHRDTQLNLSYLHIASAYFVRVGYATGSSNGGLSSEFARIATEYVEGCGATNCVNFETNVHGSRPSIDEAGGQAADSRMEISDEFLTYIGLNLPSSHTFDMENLLPTSPGWAFPFTDPALPFDFSFHVDQGEMSHNHGS